MPAEQAVAARRRRWPATHSIGQFIRNWAALIDDIGHYRAYGADDYLHDLSYRVLIEQVLAAAVDLGLTDPAAYAAALVHELDQEFLRRTEPDERRLITTIEDWGDPSLWFIHRLPLDANVVEHLKQLQPPPRAGG